MIGGKDSWEEFDHYKALSLKAIKNWINVMSHGLTIQLQSMTFPC